MKLTKGVNDLVSVRPDIASEWSDENTKRVNQVSIGSQYKAIWDCPRGHTYSAVVAMRTGKTTSCPYCSGHKVLPGFNDLATTHPELAAEWASKNIKRCDEVSSGSNYVVHWVCSLGHEWESSVCNRATGRGCPICNGKKVKIGFNDLDTTHPELTDEWDDYLTPHDFSSGSNVYINWKCVRGHTWKAQIFSRALNGTGCPSCRSQVSKQEHLLQEFFTGRNIRVFSQHKFECKLVVDLFLPDYNTVIEYDGWYWHKDRVEKDIRKTNRLLSMGLKVFRIREQYKYSPVELPYLEINHDNFTQTSWTHSKNPETLHAFLEERIT